MNIYSLTKIGKRYRNINRYRQIISVLIKYGFVDLIHRSKISKYIDYGKKIANKDIITENESTTEERIRKIFEELGTTFIKFGQILSTRPDIFPVDLITELKKLQDDTPSFSAEEVYAVIESEMSQTAAELYAEFDPVPMASASIAQVHRAKLADGTAVVVKVQKPGIKKLVEADLEIMHHLASLIERNISEARYLSPVNLVEEFSSSIEKELDFTIEASNLERFRTNFQNNEFIVTPRLFKKLSSEKIITMEYIDGVKLNSISTTSLPLLDRKEIIERGADSILTQIFFHGFFHADPHPGNIMVLSGNRICFLDYGIMGKVYGKAMDDFSGLILGIIKDDNKLLIKSMLNLSYPLDLTDRDKFERDINDLIDEIKYKNLRDINLTKLFQKMMRVLVNHQYRLKSNFYLLLKTLITIEGVGRELYPEFNIISYLEPFVKELIKNRLKPSRVFSESKSFASDLFDLVKSFPENMSDIIAKIKSGKIHIEMEHKGLDSLMERFEATYDRLSFAVVVASLLVSSALIIVSKIPPIWNGISILGISGFFVSSLLGLILIFRILKK
jgi:ubiquinone biosynthesis protein